MVPALLPTTHGGGGTAQVLGDAESPKENGNQLGPTVDSALSEHLRKEPGGSSEWDRLGEGKEASWGFWSLVLLGLCGNLIFPSW